MKIMCCLFGFSEDSDDVSKQVGRRLLAVQMILGSPGESQGWPQVGSDMYFVESGMQYSQRVGVATPTAPGFWEIALVAITCPSAR